MRAIRATVTSILVIGMLAGSVVAVAAQDDEVDALEPSSFHWHYWFGPEANVGTDPETGFYIVLAGIEAQDPRADGRLCFIDIEGGVNLALPGDGEPRYAVSFSPVRLTGRDGIWVGTYRRLGTWERDTRTRKQRKNDKGKRPLRDGAEFYEFVGMGGYEGLSMFLTGRDGRPDFGVIVPSDTVPAQPPAPPLPDCVPS